MTPTDFAYWLQGFAELTDAPPTPEQWVVIKDHLSLVFVSNRTGAFAGSRFGDPANQFNNAQRNQAIADAGQFGAAARNQC